MRLRTSSLPTGETMPPGPQARLLFLDSLRGMAALYVLVFHLLFVSGLGALSPQWAFPVLINGGSGVTLFFVVSAFSLCHAHADGFGTAGDIGDFFIRRAARIMPLFYVMLVYTLVHNASSHVFPHSFGQIVRTILLFFNLIPGEEDGIVPAAWSIGVEVMFYIIFPWMFPRLQSFKRLGIALLMALILAWIFHEFVLFLPYTDGARSSYFSASLPRRLPVFLIGIGTWCVYRRFVAGRMASPLVGGALILASISLFAAYISGDLKSRWPEPYYWEAVSYGGLLTGLSLWPIWPVVSRAMAFCGRISYSVYLLHVPVMMALTPVYELAKTWKLAGGGRLSACFVMTLAILLPLATLTYAWVEVPGMRVGKLIIAWRHRARSRLGSDVFKQKT